MSACSDGKEEDKNTKDQKHTYGTLKVKFQTISCTDDSKFKKVTKLLSQQDTCQALKTYAYVVSYTPTNKSNKLMKRLPML